MTRADAWELAILFGDSAVLTRTVVETENDN